MRRYTFEIVLEEGNDEFWDDINKREVSGADEVKAAIVDCLGSQGFDLNSTITLRKFEDID